MHAFVPASVSNGPGCRAVVWVQGCTLNCLGCFNPETHAQSGGTDISVNELFTRILALGDTIEGITVSGGEPLQQMEAVVELLKRVKYNSDLSVVLFTGYELDEVRSLDDSGCLEELTDVLIAGRYQQSNRKGSGLLGSANQKAVFFGDRYSIADLENVPDGEVIISDEGLIEITGIDPLVL